MTATLRLSPGSHGIRESGGRPLDAAHDVRELAWVGSIVLLALESGTYSFTCAAPEDAR